MLAVRQGVEKPPCRQSPGSLTPPFLDHVQINVDQTTQKTLARLCRCCMISIFPKCSLASFGILSGGSGGFALPAHPAVENPVNGATCRIRTDDLRITNALLYRLS